MIEWNDAYAIGNERIDFEHKIFIGLIAEFQLAIANSSPKDRLVRILNEILKYAEFHFVSEENLMLESGYPEVNQHRLLHMQLLSRFSVKIYEMELGMCQPDEVDRFLIDWFTHHTKQEDKRIVDHLSVRAKSSRSAT